MAIFKGTGKVLTKKELDKLIAANKKAYKKALALKPKKISTRPKVKIIRKAKKTSSRIPRTKIKLGRVNLFIEKENWNDSVNLPQYPVENGLPITDHVERQPRSVKLNGIFFADSKYTISEKIKILNTYRNKGTKLAYAGRRTGRNLAIKTVETDSDFTGKNNIPFTIELVEIRVIGKKKKKKKKSTNKKTSGGRKQTSNSKSKKWHTIKKGDTYSELGVKYGTPWKTLYKWNKYPILALPIGKKMRVR